MFQKKHQPPVPPPSYCASADIDGDVLRQQQRDVPSGAFHK